LGVEAFGAFDELRGGARVQAALVHDGELAPQRAVGFAQRDFPSPASRREATLMYLRPDSCACATASASVSSPRTVASLISIGRFTPAITSTLPLSSIEMARFDGV